MPDYLITCIRKPNRNSTHEHITHLGNAQQGWMMTRDQVIYRIDHGGDRFYTVAPNATPVFIYVVKPAGRHPYVQTYADGQWTDNLLAQPECPANCPVIR